MIEADRVSLAGRSNIYLDDFIFLFSFELLFNT